MISTTNRFFVRSIDVFIRKSHHLLPRVSYVQGQFPDQNQKLREYFYYIDHQGFLFLDDARMKNFTSCFKEIDFLEFFFTRLRLNRTGRYQDTFPFVSPCGPERNYVRCDDLPIVFTSLLSPPSSFNVDKLQSLEMNHSKGRLVVPFQPAALFMDSSGRVYHPAPAKFGSVGLVKSSLAMQFSRYFDFGSCSHPSHFTWNNTRFELTQEVQPLLAGLRNRIGLPVWNPDTWHRTRHKIVAAFFHFEMTGPLYNQCRLVRCPYKPINRHFLHNCYSFHFKIQF